MSASYDFEFLMNLLSLKPTKTVDQKETDMFDWE